MKSNPSLNSLLQVSDSQKNEPWNDRKNQTNSKEMWELRFDRKGGKYLNKHASVLLTSHYSVGDTMDSQISNPRFF